MGVSLGEAARCLSPEDWRSVSIFRWVDVTVSESKNPATPEVPMPPTKPRSGPSGCGGPRGLRWWGRHSCACLSSCPSTTKPPGTPFCTNVHAHWLLPLALEPIPAQSRPLSPASTAQAKEYPEPPKLVMGKKGSQKHP